MTRHQAVRREVRVQLTGSRSFDDLRHEGQIRHWPKVGDISRVEARKSLQVTDKFRSPANRAVVHRRFSPRHPLQEDSSDLGTCCCPGQDAINTTQQGRQLVHDAAVRCFGSDTPPLGMTFTHKHGNTQRCVTLPEEN